ncbi:tetratricopeptide repeat protein [Pseudoroseomonas cervicalis]|uniref:tetratricopeptide repeat protein n=1 Tax=Teichococcus cervicalis TaxID=204525 RepID=UPI0027829AA1|nr:tetratricopeptide repeat protein [Pseudoroseomonas cervicalis]MDQ1080572.1 tetratricopeptide (TPR) repeat protein [Pseudoroseomonas cervicalis]
MVMLVSPRRLALLAAALLAGCAAGGAPDAASPDTPRAESSRPPRPNASGAYLAGRFATAETDTAAAADQLLEALRLAPDEPEVLNRAFIATVLDGRPEAVRLARRLPQSELAQMLLAGSDAMAGRWDQAERRLRNLPRSGAAALLQPLLLAWAQAGRGDTDGALATLQPLIQGGRLRGLASLHAALIADLANRPAEAERLARQSLAESPEANLRMIQAVAGILERAGKSAEAAQLIEALAAVGDEYSLISAPEARRRLLQNRAVASPVEGMAEAELALAGALRGQGAPELSLLLARLALRLRPDSTAALLVAADSLNDEKHPESALALLRNVPEDDPLSGIVALRRATLLDRVNRTEEAIAVLRRLGERYPSSVQPPARLGDLLRSRERYAEAVEAYTQALSRIGRPEAEPWALYYVRGIALERSGQWPRAEADFQRALQLAPEQPYVLNYLGYSWVEHGTNLAEARRMLERAMELRPQDGNIADSLGWALYKLGDLPGAIRWLERAAELESRNSVINDHLGDAYWAAGRRIEAQYQWRRALTLEPEPGEAPKIAAKLRDGLPATPAAARP